MKAHGKHNHSSFSAFFYQRINELENRTSLQVGSQRTQRTAGKKAKSSSGYILYTVAAEQAKASKAADATETAPLADLADAMKVAAAMGKQKKKSIGLGGSSFAAAKQPDSLEQYLEHGLVQQRNPSASFLPMPSKGGNRLPSVTGAKQNEPPRHDESCRGRGGRRRRIVKAFSKKEASDATTVAPAVKTAPVEKAGTRLAVPQGGWICPTCLGWVVDTGCGSCEAPAPVAAAATATAVTEAPIGRAGTLLAVPRKGWKRPTCLPWGTETECGSCEASAQAAADNE